MSDDTDPIVRFQTGTGLVVEVDQSHCIVLRQPLSNSTDVVVTVTNVDALVDALSSAKTYRDILDDLASSPTPDSPPNEGATP